MFDEFIDSYNSLNGWSNPDGNQLEFGEISLREFELLPNGYFDDIYPDDEWSEDPTGNAGVTIKRKFQRATFVLWASHETPSVQADGITNSAVEWIRQRQAGGDSRTGKYIESLVGHEEPRANWFMEGDARSIIC